MTRVVNIRTILLVDSDEVEVVKEILYEWGDTGSNDFSIVEALELREAVVEEEFLPPDRAIAMFTHENIGNALPFGILVIYVLTVNEHDDVGILLDRTALTEIRQHGNRGLSGFHRTTELRQRDDRHVELLGQGFQRARNIGDFLLAGFRITPPLHQLEVVDNQ